MSLFSSSIDAIIIESVLSPSNNIFVVLSDEDDSSVELDSLLELDLSIELLLTSVEVGKSFDFLFNEKFPKDVIVATPNINKMHIKINFNFFNNLNKIFPPFTNGCNKIMGKNLKLYNTFRNS